MCSEIDQFSSFLKGMSDSRDNQQNFIVKEEGEEEKSSQPGSENPDSCREIGSELVRGNEQEILERVTDHGEGKREVNTAENEPENSVPGDDDDDDDDGFKTPTSSEHKIPAITRCPPPPRKSRTQPSKRKRKALADGARRSLRFDELVEVESIFRPASDDEDNVESKRSRKVTESD